MSEIAFSGINVNYLFWKFNFSGNFSVKMGKKQTTVIKANTIKQREKDTRKSLLIKEQKQISSYFCGKLISQDW